MSRVDTGGNDSGGGRKGSNCRCSSGNESMISPIFWCLSSIVKPLCIFNARAFCCISAGSASKPGGSGSFSRISSGKESQTSWIFFHFCWKLWFLMEMYEKEKQEEILIILVNSVKKINLGDFPKNIFYITYFTKIAWNSRLELWCYVIEIEPHAIQNYSTPLPPPLLLQVGHLWPSTLLPYLHFGSCKHFIEKFSFFLC